MATETGARDLLHFLTVSVEHFPDRSARKLLENKENVRGLLQILAGDLAGQIDFSRLVSLNRSFIPDMLREQESDLVFQVPFTSRSGTDDEVLIYILIEHQSTVDSLMGFRVLFYMMLIWDAQRREWDQDDVPRGARKLRPIVPIVFYTGDRRWELPLSLETMMDIPDELSRFVPRFDTLFLNVKGTDASVLTESDHPFGWLMTVLQKEGASHETLKEALIEAMVHLDSLDATQAGQRREAILYLLSLILYRRPTAEHQELVSVVDRHTPDMEVETMAQSMAEVLIERGLARGIEQGKAEGKAEGIEQGMAQGIERGLAQGETRAKQMALLKLLRFRFDPIPQALTDQIRSIRSLTLLDALFEQVLSAQTLEDISWQNHKEG